MSTAGHFRRLYGDWNRFQRSTILNITTAQTIAGGQALQAIPAGQIADEAFSAAQPNDIQLRVNAFDWNAAAHSLDQYGNAVLPRLLTPEECRAVAALYPNDALYRSRIVMSRHGFGRGEYKYFRYPLPEMIARLRSAIYPHLVPIANRWNEAMRIAVRFPDAHADFIRRCHEAGQTRPTPLLLEYGPDDYNCLHQDLYGEHVFPIQAAILLSQPGKDFEGGEFVMTAQSSGRPARADIVALDQGDAVVFTVNTRPVPGKRGLSRLAMRHGVSRVLSGRRHTVGIIFHDAR